MALNAISFLVYQVLHYKITGALHIVFILARIEE